MPMKDTTPAAGQNAAEAQDQQPEYGLDYPNWLLLSTAVLTGVAGPAAKFRSLGPAESVTAPSLLLPIDCSRLQMLLGRLLQAPRELQAVLLQQSSGLRVDLLEHSKFGGALPGSNNDMRVPRNVREHHAQVLEPGSRDNTHLSGDRLDALLRPTYLLEYPVPGISEAMLANCHGGRGLVITSVDKSLSNSERKTVLRLLNGAMVETSVKRRRGRLHEIAGGQLQQVRASTILQMSAGAFNAMAMDPDIAAAFVMVQPTARGLKPERLYASTAYTEAIMNVVDARRAGEIMERGMTDRVKAAEFARQHLELMQEIEDARDPALRAFATLPMALAWTLCMLYPGKGPDDLVLNHAVPLTRKLMQRQQQFLEKLRSEKQRAKEAQQRAGIIKRISDRGPMTQRELARSFSRQSHADYGGALQDLIAMGALKTDGRLLQLASPGHRASTRRRPAVNSRC